MFVELPLEPLEIRYTKQWWYWFEKEFSSLPSWIRISGNLIRKEIQEGDVLDVIGTNHWKLTQLAKLIEFLCDRRDESVLVFDADLWHSGIETLFYLRDVGGRDIKITGILHAGSYDPYDFLQRSGTRSWAYPLEYSWLSSFDLIFVGSEFHKRLLLESFPSLDLNEKLEVTGLPFYPDEVSKFAKPFSERNIRVICPHRLDPEKQPFLFEELRERFSPFLFTYPIFKSKEEYYSQLGNAKVAVSLALQETFGYAMLEATAAGCVPLVPDRLSYQEIYPEDYRFKAWDELLEKIELSLAGKLKPCPEITKVFEGSISRMKECLIQRYPRYIK